MACHAGSHGEAPVSVGRQKGIRGKPRLSLYWGFCGVAYARQDRLNSLGLASLNNPSRSWGVGVVPSCLDPDPGLRRAGPY